MVATAIRKGGIFQSLAEAWRRLARRQARMSELAALGTAESARLAHDVGLTRPELVSLTKHNEHSADLMQLRLAEEGIATKDIDPAVLRDMQRCCSECDSKGVCAHELDIRPQPANWPSYCPNQQTIAALASMKCH